MSFEAKHRCSKTNKHTKDIYFFVFILSARDNGVGVGIPFYSDSGLASLIISSSISVAFLSEGFQVFFNIKGRTKNLFRIIRMESFNWGMYTIEFFMFFLSCRFGISICIDLPLQQINHSS